MPHKQKRKRDGDDSANRDLPPSKLARPLPTNSQNPTTHATKKRKRTAAPTDDTPKAFARILAFQRTGKRPNGLDDGVAPTKKEKKLKREAALQKQHKEQPSKVPADGNETKQSAKVTKPDKASKNTPAEQALKILPGERMIDFSARVNAALPVSGLVHKSKKIDGIKERATKLQKRITRRQDEWRKNEEKRKEKEEEALDELSEDEVDYWATEGKASKRARRRGEGVVEEDPWERLKKERGQKAAFNDVVQAPPQFKKLPTEKFKVRNGALADVVDVPREVGSLRRREELGEERKDLIASYRRLMDGKRGNTEVVV